VSAAGAFRRSISNPNAIIEPLERRMLLSGGELAPTIVSDTLPTAVVGGSKTTASATVKVLNNSDVTASDVLSLYLSTSTTFDSSATLLATLPKGGKIKAGQTATVNLKLHSIPNLDGTFYILAVATDPNGNTDATAFVRPVKISPSFIALTETFSSLNLPASVTGGTSTKAIAKLDITNQGNIVAASHATIALYASTSTTLGSSATLITSASESISIKPGASKLVSVPLKEIPALADGVYHIIAKVTDPHGGVSTVASSSTVTVAAPFVSISAVFAPLTSSSVDSGGTVILTNNGNEAVDLLSYSYDENLSTDPQGNDQVGTNEAGFFLGVATSLKAGAQLKLSENFYKDISAPAGQYYLDFTLVGLGGATVATAVSSTQVTVG
jgi:hypothetical protein